MNALDAAQLALLSDLLERRRAALAGPPGLRATAGGRDRAVEEIETSPADKATVRLLNDLALEAAGHNASQLHMIKHALAKFNDGNYGECEECGNPIGFSRLQARPEARLCITCQTRAEKR
ncbi:TraR/DksA family transcriptional regulator [Massilia sp. TWP1-3-3]|uniref:TraR/DksA family transcriptional regulator n=1 Tax=Massilia sp. TWP1-3-3 TaxID=2804573 RepID=UPI003CF0F03A